MTEAFIHYLWQFQQFDQSNLQTISGEKISVFKTGFLNTNAGPDFTNARIQIGTIEWAGNVEIHLRSSDWKLHKHQQDEAYNNVILHVVWENDQPIVRQDKSLIATLELKKITDIGLLYKYQNLLDNQAIIPCKELFSEASNLSKIAILDKVLAKRLEQKAQVVEELYNKNNGDWEETTYHFLAKNFGFKLNSEAFLSLAQNLPLKVLQKHRNNLFQIEAMLFGQAGLLDSVDDYSAKLKQEYDFFSTKFSLKSSALSAKQWKFLRTRPANFPTIRLAQFANLLTQQQSFFSLFTQTDSLENIQKALKVEQSVYWQEHYNFGKKANKKLVGLGKDSTNNILINTVIPLLALYSQKTDNQYIMDKCIRFLETIPAEKNHITDIWESLGLTIKSSFDSQASIELYNNFCMQKRCLQCNVGIEILKK
ncbi:hypothetical protein EMA8858_00806 [Emticicia aquatica]|uniref:DUF2851 family protein n=1 Tax=Emticicia aquatica TaxID=1681835 RepID=A0ABN8EP63_9BACT|nr:DUF2851 family protein [Emticicia aquatica]CAH0994694.1 hypothetical protein EMA8858_00806 [Emticicia aquatica]